MAFKLTRHSQLSIETPEALYRDYRNRKIEGLLAHQADIIREYHKQALDAPDIALQLPTGSGKTLVGLLIGEWRRRRFQEKVVYLCPTRQLVNQVVEKSVDEFAHLQNAEIIPVMITPCKKIKDGALPHVQDVCYWNIEEFRNWANSAISVVRELRRSFPCEANLEWRKRAIQQYKDGGIDPASLVEKLRKQKLSDLPIEN
ncbi:DEAD/DEAH box helicase [Coleofasciculus chthonoplastes]|uniref:DEAD/DEAH box helicase n=1 Tax=Coleofasciculus chthonoplastes TaxID=64178 RepID=UPI0032FA7F5A